MVKDKCEYVSKFLRENNCDDLTNNITNGMRCTICGNVMINAHIGGCGCRYCLECVTAYLNGESRFCPSKGDDCKVELLVMDETVYIDHAMNQKISKLVVKCPRDGCQFKGELSKMEEHEVVCGKRVTKCPYCDIGCLQTPLVKDKVLGHLTDDNEFHAALLMHFISNMRNENRLMREEILSLRSAIETSRAEYELRVDVTDRDISEQRNREQTHATEVEQLREKCTQLEEKLVELERKDRKRKAESDRNFKIVHEKQLRCDDLEIRVHDKWLNVENRCSGEFVWCIDQWGAKAQLMTSFADKNYVYFSEAFYLHEQGYRMYMSVKSGMAYGYLYVCWGLMRGPFDEHLSWPFRGNVVLSFINQQTRLDYGRINLTEYRNSNDLKFDRPKSDRNKAYLISTMMPVNDITCNPAVCCDDQVLIRCVVKMQTK